MWNPDPYLDMLYDRALLSHRFAAKNRTEWDAWRHGLRAALMQKLGGFPAACPPLDPRVLESQKIEGYTRQRIAFTTEDGMEMPAYLLIPDGSSGPFAAVIACHGHGYGSREIVGLLPDGTENNGDPGYQKNFAISLVKRGFMVIVPELLGFGDRRLQEDVEKPMNISSCHRISTNLLMMGKTIAGVRTHDILRTIDYLVTRKDVDSERIGCMGISGGGLVGSFAAAIDERIRACVVSGFANTCKDSLLSIYHCVDNFIPGLLDVAEMPDIIALIAPRPLLLEAGTKDPIFPVASARTTYEDIRKVYVLLEEQDKIDIDVFEGDHRISGLKAYDWLERWL
jgi:dienelactone hydrolase